MQRLIKGIPFTQVVGNAGVASASALAENVNRRYLIIQNNHATQHMYVNFGGAALVTHIRIVAGGNYEPWICPYGEVFLIADGANTPFAILWG